jgi:hypothetical protein
VKQEHLYHKIKTWGENGVMGCKNAATLPHKGCGMG